jgi:hypothetical protein
MVVMVSFQGRSEDMNRKSSTCTCTSTSTSTIFCRSLSPSLMAALINKRQAYRRQQGDADVTNGRHSLFIGVFVFLHILKMPTSSTCSRKHHTLHNTVDQRESSMDDCRLACPIPFPLVWGRLLVAPWVGKVAASSMYLSPS